MTIHDRLVQIAADKESAGYLCAYRDDLFKHDRNALDAPQADRYIWILRDCGTELFPIAAGQDPIWATYWLKPGNYRHATPPLAYLVTVASGMVEPISNERAERLANLPHPQGKRVVISLSGRAAA